MTFIGSFSGVLAISPPSVQYFTSVLYPIAITESLAISNPVGDLGNLWEYPPENLSITNPAPQTGDLITTINYVTYNNAVAENLSITNPAPQSGSLVVTINYVTYNNAVPENLSITNPAPQSGTLV